VTLSGTSTEIAMRAPRERIDRLAVILAMALGAAGARARAQDALPPRDQWQRVPEILAAMHVAHGQRVADLAAGRGYLTKYLAAAVGQSGRVFAVEIGDEELRALRVLAASDSLANIEVIAGSESDPRLPGSLDGAVILNSYHEMTQHQAMLRAIKAALRPGAPLVLVDNAALAGWFTERDDQASHHALDPKYAVAELRDAGFEIADRQDTFITAPYAQWMIVARRPLPSPRDRRCHEHCDDGCVDRCFIDRREEDHPVQEHGPMLQDSPMFSYIPAKDVTRARRFYEERVGLKPTRELAGGVVYEFANHTSCFLYPTPNAGTSKASQAFWEVADVEREVAELRARGVTFEDYDMPGLKTVNGIATAGGAKAAWFKDTEGNTMAIIQNI
jgi:predicted methyltransferase/predicted enzyme related to lactoylglutathione lyase